MRVAIVHELLTMKGGAEGFARMLAEMFPDAPIYTLLYDEQKLGDWFPKERVITSSIQSHPPSFFSLLSSLFSPFNHHLHLSRFPAAVEAWDFSGFDLVISSSSAFAHGIITNGKPKHLSYVHSPARYLWDRTHDVQARANPLARRYLSHTFHKLRIWDAEAARRPDMYLAASKEVQRRIALYWNCASDVVYPPIANLWLDRTRNQEPRTRNYFLIVSTLAPYKRIEIAIDACNTLKLPLKIVGEGKDRKRLEQRAGSTIEFLGRREGEELKNLYAHAQAVIFPGDEDFGLVPLEAMACGTPVIAYRGGGALETVKDGETGTFFGAPTAESLAETLQLFDHKKYSIEKCRMQSENFRRSTFEQYLHTHIDRLMAL